MSSQRSLLVPRAVNLIGEWDNAGHRETTINNARIIHDSFYVTAMAVIRF